MPGPAEDLRYRGRPAEGHPGGPQIVDDAFTIGLIGPAFLRVRPRPPVRSSTRPGRRRHRVGHQRDAVRAGLEDVLPWPVQRRCAGPVDRQLPEEQPRDKKGLRRRRQHRLRPSVWPRSCATPRRRGGRVLQHLGEEGRQGLLRRGEPGQGRFAGGGVLLGYYAEAAPFVQQLRDGGFTGTFASADGTKDPEFVKQAGQSAKDAILSCPCSPATGDFAKNYKGEVRPGRRHLQPEGYDLGTIMPGHRLGPITRGPAGLRPQLTRARAWRATTSGPTPGERPTPWSGSTRFSNHIRVRRARTRRFRSRARLCWIDVS